MRNRKIEDREFLEQLLHEYDRELTAAKVHGVVMALAADPEGLAALTREVARQRSRDRERFAEGAAEFPRQSKS